MCKESILKLSLLSCQSNATQLTFLFLFFKSKSYITATFITAPTSPVFSHAHCAFPSAHCLTLSIEENFKTEKSLGTR